VASAKNSISEESENTMAKAKSESMAAVPAVTIVRDETRCLPIMTKYVENNDVSWTAAAIASNGVSEKA